MGREIMASQRGHHAFLHYSSASFFQAYPHHSTLRCCNRCLGQDCILKKGT